MHKPGSGANRSLPPHVRILIGLAGGAVLGGPPFYSRFLRTDLGEALGLFMIP